MAGSGTPTANWGISKFASGDAIAPIENLWNAQADDMEAALNKAQVGIYLRYTTKALLLANTTAAKQQHATVYNDPTTYNNADYIWNGTAWIAANAGVRFTGSIATATALAANTPIKYSTIVEDTASGWSASTGLYTVPFAGTYLFTCQVKQSTSVSVGIAIQKNGATIVYSGSAPASNTGGVSIAWVQQCAAGDTINTIIGAAITTAVDVGANNYLSIVKVA